MVASHVSGPALLTPGSRTLYRVGRSDRPLASSQITVEDAAQARAGNRFDVLGGGVLYLSTTAQGCYAETLARLRPTATMRALLKDEDPEHHPTRRQRCPRPQPLVDPRHCLLGLRRW